MAFTSPYTMYRPFCSSERRRRAEINSAVDRAIFSRRARPRFFHSPSGLSAFFSPPLYSSSSLPLPAPGDQSAPRAGDPRSRSGPSRTRARFNWMTKNSLPAVVPGEISARQHPIFPSAYYGRGRRHFRADRQASSLYAGQSVAARRGGGKSVRRHCISPRASAETDVNALSDFRFPGFAGVTGTS